MKYTRYKELINTILDMFQAGKDEYAMRTFLQDEKGPFVDAITAEDIVVRARLRYIDKTLKGGI